MYAFTYHKPSSLDHVKTLLESCNDPKLLAGGQTLIPTLKMRLASPSDVIDLGGVPDLSGIAVEGDRVVIGAMTTHAQVADSEELARCLPAAAQLAAHIGDPHVRHVGTIGGSVANNDPSADYPALCLALGATIETSRGSCNADEFFTGLFETDLGDNDIVLRIVLPIPQRAAYRKFANPASRYAMVGVCVAQDSQGHVRVAVTGSGNDGVFRHQGLEDALTGDFSPQAVDRATVDKEGLISDLHGSADYRAHLIKVMAKRAVAACG